MKTIQTVITQLTDTESLMRDVKDTLREIDPEYPAVEAAYLQAVSALEREIGDSITPGAGAYLAAKERETMYGMIYAGWLGFQLNLAYYHNPVNALLLKQDYEQIHQERRMHTLPMVRDALSTIDAFYKVLPEDKRDLTAGITDFYAYIQTTGYKLAHYFGFRLADEFLYYVVPGYTHDSVVTAQYAWDLRNYLQVDVRKLDT